MIDHFGAFTSVVYIVKAITVFECGFPNCTYPYPFLSILTKLIGFPELGWLLPSGLLVSKHSFLSVNKEIEVLS